MDIWAIGCIAFELAVLSPLFPHPANTKELVQECFAQLGQQDKIGCLGALPRWRPFLKVNKSLADFWVWIKTDPGGEAYGRFAYELLNFNRLERPDIAGCFDLWATCRHQLKQ